MSDAVVETEDKLYPLSDGERFLIHRRRLNETGEEYGKRIGVGKRTYVKIEKDERSCAYPPVIDMKSLTASERCLLHRRRMGLNGDQAGEFFGVSRFYIIRAENHGMNAESLLERWLNVSDKS